MNPGSHPEAGTLSKLHRIAPEEGMSSMLTENEPEGGIASTLVTTNPDERMDTIRDKSDSGEESSDISISLDYSSGIAGSDWDGYLSPLESEPVEKTVAEAEGFAGAEGVSIAKTVAEAEGVVGAEGVFIAKTVAEAEGVAGAEGVSIAKTVAEAEGVAGAEGVFTEKTEAGAEGLSTERKLSSPRLLQLKNKHYTFAFRLFNLLYDYATIIRNPYLSEQKRSNEFLETVALAVRTIGYVNRVSYRNKFKRWELDVFRENAVLVKQCALKQTVSRDKYYFISYLKWIAFVFDLCMYCLNDRFNYMETGIEIISNKTDLEYFQKAGGKRKLYGTAKIIVERYSRHLPFPIALESPMEDTIHPILLQLKKITSKESKAEKLFPPEDLLKLKAVRDRLCEKFTLLRIDNQDSITGSYKVVNKQSLLSKCLENKDLSLLVPLVTDKPGYEQGEKVSIEFDWGPDLSPEKEGESSETKVFSQASTSTCEEPTIKHSNQIDITSSLKSDSVSTEGKRSQTDTSKPSLPGGASCEDEQAAASACPVQSHSSDEIPEAEKLQTSSDSKRDEIIFKYETLYMENSNNAAAAVYDLPFLRPQLDEEQQAVRQKSKKKRPKRKPKK